MCVEEDVVAANHSGVTHEDIRTEMRMQFKWFLGIFLVVVTFLAGGFAMTLLDQQAALGETNAQLAVVTDNLASTIQRQSVLNVWMEGRREEVADIMSTITANQMAMVDRLHEHELNGKHK
tara:strand:+ start:2376 stop:2738 length:363 start_codon:yes stop_codon:yes gene_type:complete